MLVAINLFLAFPAFYYLFILDINFLLNAAATGIQENEKIYFNNLFNDILIIFSILFFYLIPFIFFRIIRINDIFNIKNILISIFIFSVCTINFDYNYLYSGGGIFFKLSYYFFKTIIFFI